MRVSEPVEQGSLHAAAAAGAGGSVKLITFCNMPTDGARCALDGFVRGQHFCLGVKHCVNLTGKTPHYAKGRIQQETDACG